MGGFFGAVSKNDAIRDVFFGTDYHSHLGTKRGGMAAFDEKLGFQRDIHNIQNSPFRTKFEKVFDEMFGDSAIGCISDSDPQPLIIKSRHGSYAICMVGFIQNADELVDKYLSDGNGHFISISAGKTNSVEILASLIGQKDTIEEGIRFAQETIKGSATILILKDDGKIIAARDNLGRLPVLVGKNDDGYCVSFESFAYEKLGYQFEYELKPAEIIELSLDGIKTLVPPKKEMRICSFLWTYYGYPTSSYEGINVEAMRYRNGQRMAEYDKTVKNAENLDYVCGVPDSGTPHAIGYANSSGTPFARAFIKYTPTWARSFMPTQQNDRNKVAKMKLVPVHELIKGKNLLFVDDSIVRGTQLKGTVEFLYQNGAENVHMRSACPPIMYGCKYLNFSPSTSDMDLITRRIIFELEGEDGCKHLDEYSDPETERGKLLRETICSKFNFASLEFQSVDGLIDSIGLEPCKLCTYCLNGKE